MNQTITKITLAFTALVLLGFNQINAQEERKANNYRDAFLKQLQFASQPINTNNNYASSLEKKAAKQRLDSIVIEGYNTTTSSYGNGSKKYFTYDFNGRILTSISIFWNNTLGIWQNEQKNINAYNKQGYQTLEETYFGWDQASKKWQSGGKNEYTFDNKGNKTSDISYNWDIATQTFSISQKSKTYYELNSNGKPTISYDSSWNTNTNTYDLAYKTEYTYNANNKVLVELQSYFNNGNWIPNSKNEYTYDANGNTTSRINNYWNGQNSNWYIGSIETYTFDANNNETSNIYANWNSDTKVLENDIKNESTYDGMGNLTISTGFNWDDITNKWVNSYKTQINYNNSYTHADIVWDFPSKYFKHMVTGYAQQSWENNAWVNETRLSFYYSANNFNGLKENGLTSSNIFPNPTSGLITIAASKGLETINVFDVSGKMVYSQTSATKQNNVELDLSTLSNGIYFIHAKTENGDISKSKVVVSK
ncbi:MAG: T9SS type A sorting domain-containing protein [Bacteroidia bacterium]